MTQMMKRLMVTGALLVVAGAAAMAGPERIEFPKGYETNFSNYMNAERQNKKQLARFYANDIAIEGAKKGGELPDGSILIMEVYKVKTNKDGEPIRSKNLDRLIRGELAAIMVKQKGAGWGKDYKGDKMNVGDWEFAGFKADGSRLDKNFADCRSCHSELKDSNFVFSQEHLAK